MKKLMSIAMVLCALVAALPATSNAAVLELHITANGNIIQPWLAKQVTMTLYVYGPDTYWNYSWSEIGKYRCPRENQPSAYAQGCLNEMGDAFIASDSTGAELSPDESYMVKVNGPGFTQAKAEWIWLGSGQMVFLNLEAAPLQIGTSFYSVWNKGNPYTYAWHYVSNNTSETMKLRIDTSVVAAGVTSEENQIVGRTYYVTIQPGYYVSLPETWRLPNWNQGQTYGEKNCFRVQAATRTTNPVVTVGKTCVANGQF